MKRTISIFVVLVMLASMCTFMMTGVSANILTNTYEDAKEGDLLYEVKFGETSGVYMPSLFRVSASDDVEGAVVISDEGRTLTITKADAAGAQFWYGGRIEGLTWGGDKIYTMTMKLTLSSKRGGVHFNFPTEAKAAELAGTGKADCNYSSVMYGLYGQFTQTGDMGSMIGGSRIEGRYRFDGKSGGYKEFDAILVDEGTFLDVTYLIDGYTYAIYVNGQFLDVIDLSEEAVKDVSDCLGFSAYLYWATSLTVKDVNIYKGHKVATEGATYPKYASTFKYYEAPATSETTASTTVADTTVADTTAADTTVTPETTANATKPTTTPAATTVAAKKEGGCGGAVASGFAVIALVSLAGVTVAKKRK